MVQDFFFVLEDSKALLPAADSTVQYIINLLKVMYMVLMFKYLSLYQRYFVRQIQFFSEQILRSEYSTIHALGLVPARTITRDGWYKP